MQYYALLALVPFVWACTNPDTDPCASFMTAQPATASPFCASFTKSMVTATADLPSWAAACSNKPSAISKECSCAFTGGGGGAPTSAPTTTKTTMTTTTRTTTGSGGGSTGACGSPDFSLQGYGAGTTGGGSGSGVTVRSCSDLESAAEAGGVITVSGILDGCDIIDLVSDTTVIGEGSQSGFTNSGLRIKEASNVILRNLYFHNPPEGKDLVEVQYSSGIWVDHCDFSTDGLVGDKDKYDGLLDVTHGSDDVTISWNKFHDHWKGSLVGHSDSNADEDEGHLHLTYHHNYWNNINSRLPSLRFGTGHIYSSCFENIPTSGINSRMGAQVLVEENYFESTKLAIVTDLDSDEEGYAIDVNNVFIDSSTRITQTGDLVAPYSYTINSADCICDMVIANAGLGVI
ncbi:polysaccharide lyase family 1 protein [Xylaria nigripes]|nr:polysaccharide lyase family 1 protein [Xylaria nigripes]